MTTQPNAVVIHPLTFVRRERNWSQRELVEQVARQARHLGFSMAARREKACRWESGVTPDVPTQRAMARALGVPAEHVEALPWPRWLPVFGAGLDFPWHIEGCLRALDQAVEEALFDRRGFMVLSGAALTAVAAGWAAQEPERTVAGLRGGRMDAATVTWAEERIPGLRRMDDRLSGERLLRMVDADLSMVEDLLANSSYPEHLGRRMCRTAAELGQLAGWVAFDVGRHAAAQRYYIAALHAAHTAGDRQLGANALAGMSFQATLAGNPRDGAALATTAADHVGNAKTGSARVQALIATREARAHARLGDRTACERALLRAERLLATASRTTDPDPAWIYFFDPAELGAQAGACWLDLGLPEQAAPELAQALATQDPGYVRDRTIYLTRAARAELARNALDTACHLGRQATTLATVAHSPRSLAALHELRTALRPHAASPVVREFDNALTTLAA